MTTDPGLDNQSSEGALKPALESAANQDSDKPMDRRFQKGGDCDNGGDKVGSINDGLSARQGYIVNLECFEGPLDLLLHLVRRHELDILDIPIAFIAQKYNEYLDVFRALDIEVVGEYLVMAATLAFLKSRELLPPEPNVEEGDDGQLEEGEDPKENLIRRLIEYERFKLAGDELDSRPVVGRDVFVRGRACDVVPFESGLAPLTLFRLAEAYNRVLDRAKIFKTHEVKLEAISVRERMRQIGELLSRQQQFNFDEMFLKQSWNSIPELRRYLVVTLMSILELVKLGVLGIEQSRESELLMMERTMSVDAMNRIIGSFREEPEELSEATKTESNYPVSIRVNSLNSNPEEPKPMKPEPVELENLNHERNDLEEARSPGGIDSQFGPSSNLDSDPVSDLVPELASDLAESDRTHETEQPSASESILETSEIVSHPILKDPSYS